MIFGIFHGTSISSLQKQQEKIKELQGKFLDNRARAISDTLAGISELKARLQELQSL